MIQRNLFTKQNRHTDIESNLMITKGEGWSGINQEFEVNIDTYYCGSDGENVCLQCRRPGFNP